MIRRLLFHALIAGAVVGGPIAYFVGTDYFNTAGNQPAPKTTEVSGPSQTAPPRVPTPADPSGAAQATASVDSPTPSLAEVLRFDVTAGWIMHRWPRVSTGGAQPRLQGYRVSLVTGTAKTDLAGALTYYLNSKQQVQRITFRGTTGDVGELVRLLGARFKFTRRPANDPGLFVYETTNSGGRLTGTLHVRLARLVRASSPYDKFKVDLVIERPEKA